MGEFMYAYCFYHGISTERNLEKAIEILKKPIEDGDVISAMRYYLLAVCYSEKDKKMAEEYLELAGKHIMDVKKYESNGILERIKDKKYEFFYTVETLI